MGLAWITELVIMESTISKMKRTILILFILVMCQSTKETEPEDRDMWQIGRFLLVHDTEGYYAMTGDKISRHYNRAFVAIKEIE